MGLCLSGNREMTMMMMMTMLMTVRIQTSAVRLAGNLLIAGITLTAIARAFFDGEAVGVRTADSAMSDALALSDHWTSSSSSSTVSHWLVSE